MSELRFSSVKEAIEIVINSKKSVDAVLGISPIDIVNAKYNSGISVENKYTLQDLKDAFEAAKNGYNLTFDKYLKIKQ